MRVVGLLVLSLLWPLRSVAAEPAQRNWAREFPSLACRIPHLDEHMNHGSRAVRLSILMRLGSGDRDSRVLTPFLRVLAADPDPEIAWRAIGYLYDHDVRLKATELPALLEVPMSGTINPRSAADRQRLRERAIKVTLSPPETRLPPSITTIREEARRGQALFALAMLHDDQVHRIALLLKDSKNEFTRFTAAVALLETAPPLATSILRDLSRRKVHLYGWRAAEVLARRGDRAAKNALIDHLEQARGDDRFMIADVLEDLYGFYSMEPSVWRKRVARK